MCQPSVPILPVRSCLLRCKLIILWIPASIHSKNYKLSKEAISSTLSNHLQVISLLAFVCLIQGLRYPRLPSWSSCLHLQRTTITGTSLGLRCWGFEPRASHGLRRTSPTELYPKPLQVINTGNGFSSLHTRNSF